MLHKCCLFPKIEKNCNLFNIFFSHGIVRDGVVMEDGIVTRDESRSNPTPAEQKRTFPLNKGTRSFNRHPAIPWNGGKPSKEFKAPLQT